MAQDSHFATGVEVAIRAAFADMSADERARRRMQDVPGRASVAERNLGGIEAFGEGHFDGPNCGRSSPRRRSVEERCVVCGIGERTVRQ